MLQTRVFATTNRTASTDTRGFCNTLHIKGLQ